MKSLEAFSIMGLKLQLPVEGTIPRGWIPYEYEDTNEGYDLAKTQFVFSVIKKDEEESFSREKSSMQFIVPYVTVLKEMVKEF